VEMENNVQPTRDESASGLGVGGVEIIQCAPGVDCSEGAYVTASWGNDFMSYDVTIPESGYYRSELHVASMKAEANQLGADCLHEECQKLPAAAFWRARHIARPGLCSDYYEGGVMNAQTYNLQGALSCETSQQPYRTTLPKSTYPAASCWVCFDETPLVAPLAVYLEAGPWCIQHCNGFDSGDMDYFDLVQVLQPTAQDALTCGNGFCDGIGESCDTCPDDCGECFVNHPQCIVGDVEYQYFKAWWFDSVEDSLFSVYDTTPVNEGACDQRPDTPSVDIAREEISDALMAMEAGEWQSYTVTVVTEGTYEVGMHTKNYEAANSVASILASPGRCADRAGPFDCTQVGDEGEVLEVFRQVLPQTPQSTMGFVGGVIEGFETTWDAARQVDLTAGDWCFQHCVVERGGGQGYWVDRFVFHLLDVEPAQPCESQNAPAGSVNCGASCCTEEQVCTKAEYLQAGVCVDKSYCGNGVIDLLEECDLGEQNGTRGGSCSLKCKDLTATTIKPDGDTISGVNGVTVLIHIEGETVDTFSLKESLALQDVILQSIEGGSGDSSADLSISIKSVIDTSTPATTPLGPTTNLRAENSDLKVMVALEILGFETQVAANDALASLETAAASGDLEDAYMSALSQSEGSAATKLVFTFSLAWEPPVTPAPTKQAVTLPPTDEAKLTDQGDGNGSDGDGSSSIRNRGQFAFFVTLFLGLSSAILL
jgi:hypothetical protein